jgi:hypothetical protein
VEPISVVGTIKTGTMQAKRARRNHTDAAPSCARSRPFTCANQPSDFSSCGTHSAMQPTLVSASAYRRSGSRKRSARRPNANAPRPSPAMNTLTTELTAMLEEPNTCDRSRLHNV